MVSHWLPFLLLSIHSGRAGGSLRYAAHHPARHARLHERVHRVGRAVLHRQAADVARGRAAGGAWPGRRAVESRRLQLLLYDMVGPAQLPSAVRLTAMARNLGMLVGPATRQPAAAVARSLVGHFHQCADLSADDPVAVESAVRPAIPARARPRRCAPCGAWRMSWTRCERCAASRTLMSMMLLAGGASFFIGNAYQAQMPELAHDLRHGDADATYSLAARRGCHWRAARRSGAREPRVLPLTPRTAIVLAMVWCVRARRLRAGEGLCAGHCAAARCGLRRAVVQLDGADPRAAQRAVRRCAAGSLACSSCRAWACARSVASPWASSAPSSAFTIRWP